MFGRFGVATANPELRHVPDGSDTGRFVPPPIGVTRDHKAVLTSVPLLDSADHVRGVMMNFGGDRRRTAWYPSFIGGPRWSEVSDRLNGLDSTTGRRAPRLHHTDARVVPLERRTLYLQPVFTMPVDDSPAFSYVAALFGDSARRLAPARRDGTPASGDVRGQVQAIYAAMRAALQRNDWIAFGRAMDALSRVAGNPPGGRR